MTANAIAAPPTATNLPPAAAPGRVSADILRSRLRAVRRRFLAQRFADSLCACLLAGGGILLAAGALAYLRGAAPLHRDWLLLMAGAAALTATIATAAGWMNLAQAARRIDARAATHDRFHTALAFSERNPRTPFEELTLAECTRFVERFPVRRWTPIRLPAAARFLAIPAVSLALLCWHASLRIGSPPPNPALDAGMARRATVLEKLADQLRRDPRNARSPDIERLAAQMKAAAQQLKEGSQKDAPTQLKSALGELSSLEAMLEAMKQAARNPQVSPAELAALAAALAANDQTKAAAASVQQGELEKAAGQLESLLAKLKQQGNEAQTLQQLAQSMQEQAAKLTETEKNEVARQMQDAAQGAQSGQTQLSERALQRLADLLRRAGRGGAGGQASNGSSGRGTPMTERQLEELLNALENMKEGLAGGGAGKPGPPRDGAGGGQSLAIAESFAKRGADAAAQPSGMPGSERDEGHDGKTFGESQARAEPAGPASRIDAMLGDGQSLQELVGANGDRSKASRPYRELYEALAPAAQDAIEQEDIPLGSRPFIRRYFETIRP